MVPLNDRFLMIDLISQFEAEVILISKNYLGSINHTLLSIEALRSRSIAIKGIIFNGDEDKDSESLILKYTKINLLGHIPQIQTINSENIRAVGESILPI